MTDVRDFLHAAAAEPRTPIDAAALIRRAQRRPWHRWAAWGAGAVAVLLSGAAVDVAPAGRGDGLGEPTAATQTEVGAPPTPDAAPAAAGGSLASGAGPERAVEPPLGARAADPASADGVRPAVGSAGNGDAPPAAAPAPIAEPAASDGGSRLWPPRPQEGCHLAGGRPATCSYDATEPAGFRADGLAWTVEIRRGDRVIRAESGTDSDFCEPRGFVQPGDHVTASIRETPGWQFGMASSIHVGPDEGAACAR